jgi:predicted aspartyl protease
MGRGGHTTPGAYRFGLESKVIPYSAAYDPPAPLLQVTVANTINRRQRQTLPALLDTGSDITAIPEQSVERLKLYPISQIQFEDLYAKANVVFTYKVRIVISNIVIPQIEVVQTGLNFAVIGRDVLNHLNLHLYGPQLAFEIS